MRMIIKDRNFKEESLQKELHSVKMQLNSTINHNKLIREEVSTLKHDFKQKENKLLEEFLDMKHLKEKVEDKLYKQDQSLQTVHMLCKPKAFYDEANKIVKTKHDSALVHDSEDTLEIAETNRKKMNEIMKGPKCMEKKVKIAPLDYSKENYLAIFTTQKQLTPEQIFWSNDILKEKAKALKENAKVLKPIIAMTVYPPNTPAKLVPKVILTKSQVQVNIYSLVQLFFEFDKTCKKRITPMGLTERERGFEQTETCYLTKVILFFKTIKEHFEEIQKALIQEIKEMKEIFDQMEAEVDQNDMDKKCDEIERKNLLIENENLIVDCLFKEVFYTSTNYVLTAQIKGKMKCVTMPDKKQKVLAPGMYAIDVEPIPLHNKNNREIHLDYLTHLKKSIGTLQLLEYAIGTCPKEVSKSDNKIATAPLNRKKRVIFMKPCKTSTNNPQTHVEQQKMKKTNEPVIPSTVVKGVTAASGSKPKSNTKKDMTLPAKSDKKKVEDHPRNNKSSVKRKNRVDSSISYKHTATGKLLANVGYQWKPTGRKFTLGEQCPFTRFSKSKEVHVKQPKNVSTIEIVITARLSNTSQKPLTRSYRSSFGYLDSGCSKHMTGNRSRLKNFVKQFIRTVRFGNDHFGAIMGYGDYVIDLEVAFCKHSCYVRDVNGVDLIKGNRGTNLYIIFVEDMMKSSPVCLLSKASKNKSWLWHHRLNHLNFGNINDLARKDLVRGLPRLKFEKDHICSACQLGKSKKYSYKPKSENTNMEVLHTFHMDLYGPIRVQSINGKKYILVIVDDYSRFTWVKFLRSKDETPEFVIRFLKKMQVGLNKTVRYIRTDNGTELVNQNGVVERRNRTLVEAARTMLIFSKALMFLWAEVVATACYTQNRSLIHTRHNKIPYELMHDKKPDLTFFCIFGALCYPTNDSEDLGKLKPIADIGIFVGYAPNRKGLEPILLTPGQISSGLVPNPVPAAPYVPPTNKELEILFQPMFDEYFKTPGVERPVPPAPAIQILVISAGVVVGPTIEDNPFAQADNDPFENVFAPELSSAESSSGDVSAAESNQVIQPHDHLRKWSKDHPMENIIGNPSRLVSMITNIH
ncbi:retrovirus-related pol polyprotein from transposon TNT 1-94 [Tanacetum coccineum]|uniref:Retrovirus-related pol polyprotein from transposon TNT 1-94 n=1 Tax=Tanacetum coccineum TaxID=301880 RepID=A0ABQ5DZH2_9ASTR